jgi:hypothetical protein
VSCANAQLNAEHLQAVNAWAAQHDAGPFAVQQVSMADIVADENALATVRRVSREVARSLE